MAAGDGKKTRAKTVIETPSTTTVAASVAPPLPVVARVKAEKPFPVAKPAAPVVEAIVTPAQTASVKTDQPVAPAAKTDTPAAMPVAPVRPAAGPVATPEVGVDAKPVSIADLPLAAPAVTSLIADANPVTLDVPSPVPQPAVPSDVSIPTPAAPAPEAPKESTMNETYTTAADALKNGTDQMKATMANTTESAMASGKATFDQVAGKSREAIEHGMKSVDEMAGMARGNVEAMLASSRVAAQGIESIAREVAEYSRKSFEETTAAARAMTTVKTPNELMQLQNDFAKTQFDAAVAEMSKLSETMVKLMGEVFEPMQARAAVASDKMKAMVGTAGQ